MDKKTSLSILVKQSFLLTAEAKQRILENIDKMTEEETTILGRVLAMEKKSSLESKSKQILDELIDEIDKRSEK